MIVVAIVFYALGVQCFLISIGLLPLWHTKKLTHHSIPYIGFFTAVLGAVCVYYASIFHFTSVYTSP